MLSQLQDGKYKILSLIGSGGFGNTYLALQVDLGRKVAIKEFFMKEFCERDKTTSRVVVPAEGSKAVVEKYKAKFLKEAQMIASLRSDHVVDIYDIFKENDTAYYVMDYVDGGSLKDRVEASGPMSAKAAVGYVLQVAEALSYLHSNNILHLDVKPANILLDRDGRAILIDFGISKHYDSDGGQTSTTPVGISKGYAPIEQYQQGSVANFTPATDVYSLGATLLYLLTGKTPPDAMEVTNDGLSGEVLSRFPAKIRKAIAASMQARRKERPQTVGEFKAMLSVGESDEATVVVVSGGDKGGKENKRRSSKWVFAVLAACALLAGVWMVNKGDGIGRAKAAAPCSQLDSVNYLLGVKFGSWMKSNKLAESVDELNWKEVKLGVGDFIKSTGNPYDPEFSKQFKIDPGTMNRTLSRYMVDKVSVDSASYLIGVNFGAVIKNSKFVESVDEVSFKMMHDGIEDFLEAKGEMGDDGFGRQFIIDPDCMDDVLDRRTEDLKAKVAADNLREGKEFLRDNAGRRGVQRTASGLQYKIHKEGVGSKVGPKDTVVVNYEGRFLDGKVFDKGEKVSFEANRVIKGWTEGLSLLGEGGKAIFYIPSELAYGERGNRSIGPNAVLIFDVEVLEIKKKRQ